MKRNFLLSDFDYDLPAELVATRPIEQRDESKLMVIRKSKGLIEHHSFKELPEILHSGDRLIFNDTKVVPARVKGRKDSFRKGALLDILLLGSRPEDRSTWVMLLDPVRKIKVGTEVIFGEDQFRGVVMAIENNREVWLKFDGNIAPERLQEQLYALGQVPLPPYLKKAWNEVKLDRYQTVYAEREGSLAAPTAGLHFTAALLDRLREQGIEQNHLTLQVGLGTFDPIYEDDFSNTLLHEEWFEIPERTARNIRAAHKAGKRVIAVGTTSLRALESSLDGNMEVIANQGNTQIFLKPGHVFHSVDGLLTNFHVPKSSLLILIAAFMGYDLMREAYKEAISHGYRFYSFGDSMLILP